MQDAVNKEYFEKLDFEVRFWLLKRQASRVYFIMPSSVPDNIRTLIWEEGRDLGQVFKQLGIADKFFKHPKELKSVDKINLKDFIACASLRKIPKFKGNNFKFIDDKGALGLIGDATRLRTLRARKLIGADLSEVIRIVIGFLYPYEGALRDYSYDNLHRVGILKEMLPIKTLHPDAYYWSEDKNINVLPCGGNVDPDTITTKIDLAVMDIMELWTNIAISFFIMHAASVK